MKKLKKIFSILVAGIMTLMISITAYADNQPTSKQIQKAWFECICGKYPQAKYQMIDSDAKKNGVETSWYLAVMHYRMGLYLKSADGKAAVKGIDIKDYEQLDELSLNFDSWAKGSSGLEAISMELDSETGKIITMIDDDTVEFKSDGTIWTAVNKDGETKATFPVLNQYKYINDWFKEHKKGNSSESEGGSNNSTENGTGGGSTEENASGNATSNNSKSNSEEEKNSDTKSDNNSISSNNSSKENNSREDGNNTPVTPEMAEKVDKEKAEKEKQKNSSETSNNEDEKESETETKSNKILLIVLAVATLGAFMTFIYFTKKKK